MSALASSLQAFFTDRLVRERGASPHTIASYRDTIRLLLRFAAARTGVEPCQLSLDQLDAPLIGAFLDHLETDRGCGARTRNTRLGSDPHLLPLLRAAPPRARSDDRAGPADRTETPRTRARDLSHGARARRADRRAGPLTWTGRRDHAIIILLAQTGLRATELTGLRCSDIHLGTGAHTNTIGKGRKQRITPLTNGTVAILKVWQAERDGHGNDPLFPTSTGKPLTRKALARRIAKHANPAAESCPSLREKTITPHALRHTAAMRLLHAGIDTSMIALWLGHEQVETTQVYLHADLAIKERALAKTKPLDSKPGRYRPPDALLDFLERL